MALTIDSKVISLKVQKYLNSSQEHLTKSMQRLSTGLRVNRAKDDAAGLAIAERMNAHVRSMNVGMRNANDGVSMSQTAEGGLKKVNELLQRMRELAVQSANGTYSSLDREKMNAELSSLNNEISRIASTTQFNGRSIFPNGGGSVTYQLGSEAGSEDTLTVALADIQPLNASVGTASASLTSISAIDAMLDEVASSRANFGAMQSRFESAMSNLQTGVENQSSARGRIMDADYAVNTAMLTRSQIMQQAGAAMSAQANVSPASVQRLLG